MDRLQSSPTAADEEAEFHLQSAAGGVVEGLRRFECKHFISRLSSPHYFFQVSDTVLPVQFVSIPVNGVNQIICSL